MPSVIHEALILLFRNRPALAAELVRDVLHADLPAFTEARIGSADLTEIQPAEFHADLVIELVDHATVGGIVVEVQRSVDENKRLSWPSYAAVLRARLKREVCVLVVTPEESVARWAARPIALGGGTWFTPLVLGPSAIPQITDESAAGRDPELAVLSAMAHGRDEDPAIAASIASAALAASVALDPDRSRLYCDLILASLGEATRRELQSMDPAKYEYQSDFAKHYIAVGKEEGRADVADFVKLMLTLRFGVLAPKTAARVSAASIEELRAIGKRLPKALTLEAALGESGQR